MFACEAHCSSIGGDSGRGPARSNVCVSLQALGILRENVLVVFLLLEECAVRWPELAHNGRRGDQMGRFGMHGPLAQAAIRPELLCILGADA